MIRSFFSKVLRFIGIDRFTRCSRKVFFFARHEAKRLHSKSIDTEHILLAIIQSERGIASTVLLNLGMSLTEIQKEVESLVKLKSENDTEDVDIAQSRNIVLQALRESKSLNHHYIGTEDLLLSLLHFKDAIAAQALANLKLDSTKVRPEIERILSGEKTDKCYIKAEYLKAK